MAATKSKKSRPTKKKAARTKAAKKSAAKKASGAKRKRPAASPAKKKTAATKKGKKKPLRKGPDTEVTEEVLEFIRALDDYKREKNRPFPTWSEVLEVVRRLGYRKTAR